jgi:hypothetical protein
MLNVQPGSFLQLWEWREDKINLIGATQSITVRVRYEKILPILTLGTDPIQIRAATDALGFATAALAIDLLGTAQTAIEELINRYIRPEQTKGRRRKPYGYRRRAIYWRIAARRETLAAKVYFSEATMSVQV